ncbi:MAG: hypothetical protein QM572_02215, partial [Nocardioides sp.]|uniref:hypothetical protein n=1 Tax=Nocardioides sp. TaxID=35761 RepID=UPI0039E2C981
MYTEAGPGARSTARSVGGPSVLDGAALLAEVADELVLRTVHDTHRAIGGRVHRVAARATAGASAMPTTAHAAVSEGVYAAIGLGLRAARAGLDQAARRDGGGRAP